MRNRHVCPPYIVIVTADRDGMQEELRASGVRVDDRAREWRADGEDFDDDKGGGSRSAPYEVRSIEEWRSKCFRVVVGNPKRANRSRGDPRRVIDERHSKRSES